jgi:hypothetical protein
MEIAWEETTTTTNGQGWNFFLIDSEKRRFKATVVHELYFYLLPKDKTVGGIVSATAGGGSSFSCAGPGSIHMTQGELDKLRTQDTHNLQFHYQELLAMVHRLYQPKGLNRAVFLRKIDLDATNHLGTMSQTLGGRPMIKLIFDNVDQLARVKKEVSGVLIENERKKSGNVDNAGFDMSDVAMYNANHDEEVIVTSRTVDPLSSILDMREHDVPYLVRVCIDLNLRAGCWYTLTPLPTGGVTLSDRATLPKASPTVLAFDIE